MKLSIDYNSCLRFISKKEIETLANESLHHLNSLREGNGKGSDFLGWLNLPEDVGGEVARIESTAKRLRENSETTVVVGIGGSYLGSKAVIEALHNSFNKGSLTHEILFAGQNISEDYLSSLLDYLGEKTFNIIVISKSGTTTEPAIAFRLLKNLLENKIGKAKAARNIVAITDSEKGALRKLADKEGYETFSIPNNVGGRYSVLTPVGLLPIAVAGLNIRDLLDGALKMAAATRDNVDPISNPALIYASIRNMLYEKGKIIEMLINFDPRFHYIGEWWKQLFGESEGKDGRGVFPASADMTTDLHSMGQYIQDGKRILFETVLSLAESNTELRLPSNSENFDNLNYIAGKRISEVNLKAEEGTIMAHNDGDVPVFKIIIPALTENYIGQLLYFFEISCAISGYILGINPFDQPGVEAYKKNMFDLLGM